MKNKKVIISLIIFLSILVILLSILFVKLLTNKFSFKSFKFSYNVSNTLVLDEVYNNDFDSIIIKSDSSDIYLKTSNDNSYRVVIYGDKDKTKVLTDNNILDISTKEKKCIGFCINRNINKVEVYIPKDYDKKININNKYGDITIEDFDKSNIEINEDCGDIKIDSAFNIKIKNSYGDTSINKANQIDINSDCGDIEIGDVANVVIKNSYGDISIEKIIEYLNIKDDCGNIDINSITLTKNSNIKSSYGDIKIKNIQDVYVDAKTSLGDTTINKNSRKSNIILNIDSSCGDISVN